MNKLILLAISAIISLSISAQTIPNTFSYQGRCDAKNTDIEIEFQLKDASEKTVYTEKKTVQTSVDGTYAVILGGGDGWTSIDWTTSGYKLTTKINGHEVSECEIVSVPYANMASDVIGLDEIRSDIKYLETKTGAETDKINMDLNTMQRTIDDLMTLVNISQKEIEMLKANLDSVNQQVNTPNPAATNHYDMLSGKKWYVIGDSFTSGGWSDSEAPYFTEGIYAGEKKVYPYFIGNRTGIEVHNLAVAGMSLAASDNTVMDIYQNIPEDADYVTIYIGINDNHWNIKIGKDNSTNKTEFSGAFNILLEWLVTNRPYTHLGIIVPPSSRDYNWSDYDAAIRRAAERYGVPLLDIGGGDDVPYFLRQTEKEGVLDSIRQLRDTQYRLGKNNNHPNEHAHELESYIIEHFLRRI